MYVLEYVSKLSREPLFLPHFLLRLFSSSDTPQLAVRWSTGLDRGVCPLITKRSQGAYAAEKKTPSIVPQSPRRRSGAVSWLT